MRFDLNTQTNKSLATAYGMSTLSQKSATVAVFSPFSATVAVFCDSVDRALNCAQPMPVMARACPFAQDQLEGCSAA